MRIASSAARCIGACLALALAAISHDARAEPRACAGVDYNSMIIDIIRTLPAGGGYSLGDDFVSPKLQTHNIGGGRWELRVYDGFPSHCTSATYALYAHLAALLHNGGKISLTADQLRALEVKGDMPDGTRLVDGQGPYWIFNSNGAGVAAFFKHTGTGISFRDDKLAYARPGDFLKLFWNDGVGASEKGHQVVYLGQRVVDGRDMICFWGSQRQGKKKRGGGTQALYFPARDGAKVHNGYGEACRPRSDIKAMIFSRVTCMENLSAGLEDMQAKADARGFGPVRMPRPFEDEFLMSLRKTSSDQAALDRKYDILPEPSALAGLTGASPR
jgi:hypothetical protein